MRKLKLFFACLLMAVLSIGQVWAADVSVPLTSWSTSISTYSSTVWTDNDCSFTYASNNQKNWAFVRCGGKNTTATSTIKYNSKVTIPVDSIVLNTSHGINGSSGYNVTITGISVSAYSNAACTSLVSSKDLGTLAYTHSNCPASIKIAPTSAWAKDLYYVISITWTETKNKNAGLDVSGITFYESTGSGSSDPTISAGPVSAKYATNATIVTPLSVTAAPHTSGKTLSYQWYSNTTNTATVDNNHKISGATNSTYTPSVSTAGTKYYYCVVSEQDGGSKTSSVASIEVKAPQTIAQIMPTGTSEGAEFVLNDVTVTYANGKNIYVKDASGYMLVYDNNSAISGAANGKVLHGLWGKAKLYNGLPEISTVTTAPSVTDGTAVEPIELTEFPTTSDVNKYVVLNEVTFASAQTLNGTVGSNFNGTFKSSTLAFRNNFLLGSTQSPISIKKGTTYRVEGIVNYYNALQFYPISFEEQHDPTMTVNPTALDFGTIGVGDDAPDALTFAVSGSYLTANLSATVTAGSDYYGIEVTAGDLEKDGDGAVSATITVTPKAAINVSAGTINGTVTVTDGGSLSQTVSLTTVVKAKHTVTWNNNGGTSTTQVLDGEKPAFPATPVACDATSTTFVGWATAPWEDKIATLAGKTVYTAASAMPEVTTEDVVYYAVFAKSAGDNFDGTTGGEFYIYADIEDTKYFAKAFASKIESTDDISEAVKYTFEKIVEDEITYFAIKSGDNYLGWSSSTNFSTDNAEPVKFLPTAGTRGTWRLKVASTLEESTVRSIVYRAGTTNKFAPYGISNISTTEGCEYYDVEIGSGADMTDYMTTCCEAKAITIASPIANGSVSADKAEACEGKTVTLTPTADPAYHFDAWDVYKTGESATKVTVTSNQFTMPAYAVTVSATFEHDACDNLGAPTLNGTIEPTYNSATIAWNEVTGAVAYAVTITNHTTSDVVFSGNVTELYKALTGLDPETQYDYSVMAVGDGVEKCADGNGLLEDNFTTAALPTVQLYYVKKQGADPIDGGTHTLGVEFDLVPSDLSCTKTFVGWTDEANKDYTHATEAPSVLLNKYTFTSEAAVTLYAVYAEVGPATTTYTLTPAASMSEGVYVIAAYDENYKALTGGVSSGKLVNETTGFAIDANNKIVSLPDDACEFTFTAVTGGFSIQKPNGDYLGYTSTSDNNKLAFGNYSSLVWSVNTNSDGVSLTTSEYKVSANASAGSDTWVRGYKSSGSIYNPIYLFKKATAAGTATNYATTCTAAPVATPDPASLDVVAAGASGTITMAYDNVNTEGLAVTLCNDAEGNVAFTGDWLTASLSSTNISYTVNPNTTYVARTAYIKLTAPETTGATDPAVVIIPVTQAKYIPEFASLAALVAADPAIPSGTDVKVSFSHVQISDDIAVVSSQRRGVYLDQKAANDKDVEIYYAGSPNVPASWVKNGYVSATNLVATWTYYNQYSNNQWELVPADGFNWENDLEYEAPSAAVITVTPAGNVNFGSVAQGADLPAAKTLSVTLTNVAAATATLGGTNADAFSLTPASPAALTASGDITISVVSTATAGEYTATLTISDDASAAETKEITISLTVTAPETPEAAVATDSKWVPATEITDGMQVLIVGVNNADYYAMGAQANNNRTAVQGAVDGEGVFTPGVNTMAFTVVDQLDGTYALQASNGKYLYAAASGNNYLRTQAGVDDNAKWTLSLTSAVAESSSNRNVMQFNSGSSIFSCYASASQKPITLYVPKPAPAPEYETVRSGLEINRYYTVCLPKKVTAIKGASFWTLNNKSQDGAVAYLEEETNNLPFEAGKPFIIQATAENLEVIYEGDATNVAGTNGALHGTLVYMDAVALAAAGGSNVYMLFSNELRPVGENNHLDANRAYVLLSELNAVTEAPQSAPGKRVRAMPMQPQVATGMDALNASDAPVKVMIDGQLFIIRGEKMFDATGRLVK